MLNILLCTGRSAHLDEYGYTIDTGVDRSPPRKKVSVTSTSSKRKGGVSKLQIGAPSDFRHESHMGYDEVNGLDVDRYQREIQTRMTQQIPSPTATTSVSQPADFASRTPVKRKPAPSPSTNVDNETSYDVSVSRPRRRESAASSTTGPSPVNYKKPLVPLYGDRSDVRNNAPYVTQTAKIRWDGAMAEIEKALKEER